MANAIIYNNGTVEWTPPAVFHRYFNIGILTISNKWIYSSCRIRVRHFPFDVQLCQMQFQSWVYSSQEVSLELRAHDDGSHGAHKDDFTESGEWDIVNLPGTT